jgi:hypothetical protein
MGKPGTAFLDPERVLQIRERRSAGESCVSLSKAFGVTCGVISMISTGRIWREVGGPLTKRIRLDHTQHAPRKKGPSPVAPSARFWLKVNRNGPLLPRMNECCWEWTGGVSAGTGYGSFMWSCVDGKVKHIGAHVASWFIHFGHWASPGHEICHHCDNRLCVRPEHLFVGTRQDNMDDMISKGRSNRGERNPCAKLNADKVKLLLSVRGKMTAGDAGKLVGVGWREVFAVWSGERWSDVTGIKRKVSEQPDEFDEWNYDETLEGGEASS